MRLASALAASALLSAALAAAWARAATSGDRPSNPTLAGGHLERGRKAYAQGYYERCLEEMMLALLADPQAGAAREYLRLASEGLLAQRHKAMDSERSALLAAYHAAIGSARVAARRWNDWLFHARRAARKGRWAASYDGFYRVWEENPLHEDARQGLGSARIGMARALAQWDGGKKDALIYTGLMAFHRRETEEAKRNLEEALARSDLRGELPDGRIRAYLRRLAPPPVPKPAVQPAAPSAPQEPARPAPPMIVASVRPAQVPAAGQGAAREASMQPRPDPGSDRLPGTAPGENDRAPGSAASADPRPAASRPAIAQPGQWAHAQGAAKLREGRLEQAIELLQQAAAQAPDNEDYRRDLIKARHDLEESQARRKADAQRSYTLGILLYGQGRPAEAASQWRNAVELDPEHLYAARALHHVEQELEDERP